MRAISLRMHAATLSVCLIGCTPADEDPTDTSAGSEGSEGSAGSDDSADSASETGAAQGSFADAILSAMWADDITITVGSETIDFASDGFPDHDVLEAYALMDGTTTGVVSINTSFSIPVQPVYSDTVTDTGMGTIGFAISGGVYFNPYEGDGTSVALDNNFDVGGVPFVDSCNGHPLPTGDTYHYHGVPYCITDAVDGAGAHSALIGVLLDGFPVYGPNGVDGSTPTDLDECSGHDGATPEFPEGVYHYHLTETAPYSITCYHGEVAAQGGGMMPPPMGG